MIGKNKIDVKTTGVLTYGISISTISGYNAGRMNATPTEIPGDSRIVPTIRWANAIRPYAAVM
jgi:hypothetical protein